MDIAIIGLGKMGGNMAQRLLKGGQRVVGLDQSAELTRKLAAEHGLTPVFSTGRGGGGPAEAAHLLADGPGRGGDRGGGGRTGRAAFGRGRDHRRRQYLLQG